MVWKDLRWRQSSFSMNELGGEESGDEHGGSVRGPFVRRSLLMNHRPDATATAQPCTGGTEQRWIATSGAGSAPKRRTATFCRKNDGGSPWVLRGA